MTTHDTARTAGRPGQARPRAPPLRQWCSSPDPCTIAHGPQPQHYPGPAPAQPSKSLRVPCRR